MRRSFETGLAKTSWISIILFCLGATIMLVVGDLRKPKNPTRSPIQVAAPSKAHLVAENVIPTIVAELTPTPALTATATPVPTQYAPSVPDVETLAALETERRALAASLEELRAQAQRDIQDLAKTIAAKTTPPPAVNNPSIVRELDFSGHSPGLVEQIMGQYNLRIVNKYVTASSPNTFLSSAALGPSHTYYAMQKVRPGFYNVFELSPNAIRKMSQLEEEQLRQRGLDPARTIVRYVKFGIVQTPLGTYDLGIIAFEASPLP